MLSISEQRKRRRALPRRRLQRGGRRPPSGAGAPHAGGGRACGRPRFLARMLTLVGSAPSMRPYSSQCSLSSAHA
jgi:hypothetical protein